MESYPSVEDLDAVHRSSQSTGKKRRPASLAMLSKSYHSFSDKLRMTRPSFEHTPLNHHEASIRLIHVEPDQRGDDTYIKCSMTHTTVDANYTCLSYVWGSKKNAKVIQINGRPFKINQNLWDFLNVARTKYPGMPFWIDALCIQQNDDQERNHQVQQMGKIYSQAREVFAWLGNKTSIAYFFAYIRNSRHISDGFSPEDIHTGGLSDFLQNEYWTRAWITQELLLPRLVTFLSGMEEVGLDRIARGILYMDTGQVELSRIRPFINVNGRGSRLGGKSLYHLLYLFREKKCSVPRDRVYSLLSLCAEGSNLMVDYVERDEELIPRVLRACPKSSCFCSVALLMQTLGVSLESIPAHSWENLYSSVPILELELESADISQTVCPGGCHLPSTWSTQKPHLFHLYSDCCRTNFGHLYWEEESNTLQYAPGGTWNSGIETPSFQNVYSDFGFQLIAGPWKTTDFSTNYRSMILKLKLDFRTLMEIVQSELEAKLGIYDLCGKAWGHWEDQGSLR